MPQLILQRKQRNLKQNLKKYYKPKIYKEFSPINPLHLHSKNLACMFAVIKIAGQQFKVQPGQNLYVPHLSGNAGDKLEFSEILLHDNEGKISVGQDAKVTVKAEIVNDLITVS